MLIAYFRALIRQIYFTNSRQSNPLGTLCVHQESIYWSPKHETEIPFLICDITIIPLIRRGKNDMDNVDDEYTGL